MNDKSLAAAEPPAFFNHLGSFADELCLANDGEGFGREISPFWTFAEGRVFGGYTAALLLAAAARATGFSCILSCQVMFLGITRAGPVRLRVEVLRQGRAAVAVRAIAEQAGEVTADATAWFASALPGSQLALKLATLPHPENCVPIAFRAADIPFMSVMEERTIDYPLSNDQFVKGSPCVELWSRLHLPEGSADLPLSQLFDLLLFDAHMLEPALRSRASPDIWTASLNLTVMWVAALPSSEWRRLRVESGLIANGFVATHAILSDIEGNSLARATQQGRARTGPSSAK